MTGMMSLPVLVSDKLCVISVATIAALAAFIYVLWEPKISGKPKKKLVKKDGCPGLLNQGNSCFLNAILQACATSPSFRCWLEERGDSGQTLISKLLHVVRVLNNELDDGDYGSPYDVIDALRAKRWIISSDEQDAHELFEVLTQSIDEETSPPRVLPLFDVAGLEVSVCECCVNRWGTESPCLVRDPPHTYQGLLASRLQCQKCQYIRPIKYDQFDCISLGLPASSLVGYDLCQLLNNFIKPELVDGVDCDGCTRKYRISNPDTESSPAKSTFWKETSFGKLPASLCVHVQRTMWLSNGIPYKRAEHVTFPEYLHMDAYTTTARNRGRGKGLLGGRATPSTVISNSVLRSSSAGLTLSPVTTEPASHQGRKLYRLSAVIEHLGDVNSGHFVTHRRAPYSTLSLVTSPNWLYTSDTMVKRTRFTRVQKCCAYMLFYERVRF